jgi:4-amino-4-deoxy-L-arabinose transferase-like glycosyltransferase
VRGSFFHRLISPNGIARHRVDAALALALFLFAVALRLPYLYLIPTWADDMNESIVALRISHGVLDPFVVMAQYTGPVHPDIVALALKFFAGPLVPRAVNFILASLTVPAVYFFGRALRNEHPLHNAQPLTNAPVLNTRAIGVIAALLLATSSTHIVMNSHLAYSSATTPFFATLACLFLALAYNRKNVWWLGAAGVSFALAMQTHPVAIALAPGLLIWFFMRPQQWKWFRRPSLYLAALVTVVAYAPILYSTLSDPHGLSQSIATRTYAIETHHSLANYLGNLQNLILEVLRMVGAHYAEESRPLLYLTDPFVLAYALVVPLAVVVAIRRGRTLPVFALVSAALIIPYFNYQYGVFPYFTRYVALLLPILYILVASLSVEVWNWVATRTRSGSRAVHASAQALMGLMLVAGIAIPIQRTSRYYDDQVKLGATNAPFMKIIERVDSEPEADILIDESLRAGEFPSGGNLNRALRSWFRFQNRPFTFVNIKANQDVPSARCTDDGAFLIATTEVVAALPTSCPLVRLLEYTIPLRPGRGTLMYGLYEFGASP